MFGNKKLLKKIKNEKENLESLKQELLFIKENLANEMPKIDISNLYVWQENGLRSIVKLDVKNIRGKAFFGLGVEENGYETTLTDIFTNKIVYVKRSLRLMKSKEWISCGTSLFEDGYYAYLDPIYKFDNNILAYINKKVPLYVLQQLYYRLNNVNVNSYTLKKEK